MQRTLTRRDLLLRTCLPLALVIAAAVRMYRSPWSASLLHVIPDSVEYAVCAQRVVTLGHFDVEIAGRTWPAHCTPWFSVLVLAPAYLLAPHELGAGIIPVLLFSLAGVLAAFLIGRRLSGDWGGAAAVLVLVSSAVYRPWSREIMTDVPAAVLGLWGCVVFLRLADGGDRVRSWALAGALIAGACALRSEYTCMLLPFAVLALRQKQRIGVKLPLLVLPWIAVLSATAVYNRIAIGEWFRTGYHFWTPIPWDYPSLLFSAGNVPANLRNLVGPWALPDLLIGAIGILVLLVRRSAAARDTLLYTALAAIPGSVAHTVFFHTDIRFHVFLLSLLCILGGAGVASLVPDAIRRVAWPVPVLVVPLWIAVLREPDPIPVRRIVAETLSESTPGDSVIVSAIDPVYLESMVVRGTRRRVIPVSREVEYASKLVAWKRLSGIDPATAGPRDHRSAELRLAGAEDVCEFTADERPDLLLEWVRQGLPVYVDRSFLPLEFPLRRCEELGMTLESSQEHPWLGRLILRN